MKTVLTIYIGIILLQCGCRQQEPLSQLKEINKALEKANLITDENNRHIYEEIGGKLEDPRTHSKATIWVPRAQIVQRCAFRAKLVIGGIKDALIKRSDSLQSQDLAIVKKILNVNGNGGSLFEKLTLFIDSTANAFSKVVELNRDSTFIYKKVLQLDVTPYSKENWLSKNFDNCSPLLALMTLNKIESDLINSENFLITYCNYNVVFNFCGYFTPSAMASLSSNIVKSGDTIMISAGVGLFDTETSPVITINGTRMKLHDYPIFLYRYKASGKPGAYNIPVNIEYTGSDGSRKTETRNLGYIIADDK